MSVITDIAEAVKDELNAESFSPAFTAVRAYRPVYELPDMDTLRVTVMPRSIVNTADSRTSDQYEYGIDVAIQKKFTAGDNDELDGLMDLVEEIADFLNRRPLESMPGAAWAKTENASVFIDEHMEQYHQFTSVLTLTYRMRR